MNEQQKDKKKSASALGTLMQGKKGMRHVINYYETKKETILMFEDKEERNILWKERKEFNKLGIQIEKCRTLVESSVQDWLMQGQRKKIEKEQDRI